MAWTSENDILSSEDFETWIEEKWLDTYGMGFIQELDPDKGVYHMDEFNDLLCGMEPLDIACRVNFGDMNMADDWFYFNGYGNIETLSEYSLHSYLWNIVQYELDEFHEYLLCYYRDEYEEEFYKNFPLLEEVSGLEPSRESEEDFYERSYSRIIEETA